MDKLKITIDGKELDLGNAEKLNIANTYAIADINDIDVRKNSTTKEIKVPATKINKQIFGFPDDIASAGALNQKTLKEGVMTFGGVEIMRGPVKFIKPVVNNVTEYVFTIIGESGDWRNKMDKKRLRDLNLSDQEHTYTKQNINISENVTDGRIYSYPVVNDGRLGVFRVKDSYELSIIKVLLFDQELVAGVPVYPVPYMVGKTIVLEGFGLSEPFVTQILQQYNISEFGTIVGIPTNITPELNGPGIFYLQSGSDHVKVTDRPLAIQIKGLVERIYKELGYKVQSNFIDNIGRKLFLLNKMIQNNELSTSFYQQLKFKAKLTADQTILHNSEPDIKAYMPLIVFNFIYPDVLFKYWKVKLNTTDYDESDLFDELQNCFIPRVAGQYRFNFKATVTATPIGNFRASFLLVTAGQTIAPDGLVNGPVTEIGFGQLLNETEPAYNFNFEMTSPYFQLYPGDRVFVVFRNTTPSPNDYIIKAENCEFTNELYEKDFTYGSVVNLQRFLPDTSQLDFIKALKQLFNLYFLTDVARKCVYIEPRDQFYTDKVLDWSDKVDLSKEIEITELGTEMEKRTMFAYGRDSNDITVENTEKSTDYRLASFEASIDNIFVEDSLAENENELFGPTLMGDMQQSPAVNFTITQVPVMRNFDEEIDYKTRLLFYEGKPTDLEPGENWKFENEVRNTFPRFYSIDKKNYNYNSLYFDSFSKSIGLFEKHYGGMWNEIKEGKMVSAYLNLKATDLQGFVNIDNRKKDYRATVLLNYNKEQHKFRINAINDFDPLAGKSTKVDLIKITDSAGLPVYPIPYLILIEISATDGVAGGNTNVCVTISNIGSQNAINVNFSIHIPGMTDEDGFAVNIPVINGQSTVTVCNLIPIPATTATGGYSGFIDGDVNGGFEFFVNGCDTLPDVQFVELTGVPGLNQLVQGGTVDLKFTIENNGCLVGSGDAVVQLRHVITEEVLREYIVPNIVIAGLSDRDIMAYFSNLPVGYANPFGPDNLTYLVALNVTGIFSYDGFLRIPPNNVAAPPRIISKIPVDDSVNVVPSSLFSMTFNEPVTAGTGFIKVFNLATGILHQQFTAANMVYNGATVSKAFTPVLDENTEYFILVDNGFVKNAANVVFTGLTDPAGWNFKTGAYLLAQVSTINKINGWTSRQGNSGQDFTTVRNQVLATHYSSNSTPPIILELLKQSNSQWLNKRGHAFFKTDNILPAGKTLMKAYLSINRTLLGSPNDAYVFLKHNSQFLNSASYSFFDWNPILFTIPAEVGGVIEYEIPISLINLSGWSNFSMVNTRDFYNNVSGCELFVRYSFAGSVNLILKYI